MKPKGDSSGADSKHGSGDYTSSEQDVELKSMDENSRKQEEDKQNWRKIPLQINNKVKFKELIEELQQSETFDLAQSQIMDRQKEDKHQGVHLMTSTMRIDIFQYEDGHFEAEVMPPSVTRTKDSKPEDFEKPYLDAFEKFAEVLFKAARQTKTDESVFVLRQVEPKKYVMDVIRKLLSSGATAEERAKPENNRFQKVRYGKKLYKLDEKGNLAVTPSASALLSSKPNQGNDEKVEGLAGAHKPDLTPPPPPRS